jgi:hypothetical protein
MGRLPHDRRERGGHGHAQAYAHPVGQAGVRGGRANQRRQAPTLGRRRPRPLRLRAQRIGQLHQTRVFAGVGFRKRNRDGHGIPNLLSRLTDRRDCGVGYRPALGVQGGRREGHSIGTAAVSRGACGRPRGGQPGAVRTGLPGADRRAQVHGREVHRRLRPAFGFVAMKGPRRQHGNRGDRRTDEVAHGLLPPWQRRTTELSESHADGQHQPECRSAGPGPAHHARDRTGDRRGENLPHAEAWPQLRTHADTHRPANSLGQPGPPPGAVEAPDEEDDSAGGSKVGQPDELQFAEQGAGPRDQRRGTRCPKGGPHGPGRIGWA